MRVRFHDSTAPVSSSRLTTSATGSGFKVKVTNQAVTDPSEQGIVLDQQPAGGTNAPAGSTVTIVVGKYTGTTTAVP